jgi:hypothetical protein
MFKIIIKLTVLLGISVIVLAASIAWSTPPEGYSSSQSWEEVISDIKGINEGVNDAKFINERLYNPAMEEKNKFVTMDGSQVFTSPFLCQGEIEIVQVGAESASNGELNISISYDAIGAGTLNAHLVIPNVGGACYGGAVYDCQPAGSWTDCKYGAMEFNYSTLNIKPEYDSGEPRPAVGLQGCFCFSDHCGGTTEAYMQNILSHIGQWVADQIAANRGFVLSGSEYLPEKKMTRWFAGDMSNCGTDALQGLTSQYGKLEMDFQGTLLAQEEDSPWDLLSQKMEISSSQFVCVQQAKISSEWTNVQRVMPTEFGITWDETGYTDGGSPQCAWFDEKNRTCGEYFGEPKSWQKCMEQFANNRGLICYSKWVKNGYFTSIVDVRNVEARSEIHLINDYGMNCYGAGDDPDPAQLFRMDCVGIKLTDKFICYSPSKGKNGEVIYNEPYDPAKYEGCDEIRQPENSCAQFEAREDCKLIKEETDGVITISNGALTTIRSQTTCRTIKGVSETRVVCEPWWKKVRTYDCSDILSDWEKEKERVAHITQNIQIDDNKYLMSYGDWLCGKDEVCNSQVVDVNFQFDQANRSCIPACVIQTEVQNYELIVPAGQGKLATDGNYHVEEPEPSVVPTGTRTILETKDCAFDEEKYICPIPEGWAMRSQCSCADGESFLNAITALEVINQTSKDFICSTGQEYGVCSAEDENLYTTPVVCGNLDSSTPLKEGVNYWQCQPKLWRGDEIAAQNHVLTVDFEYSCILDSVDDPVKTDLNLGPLTPEQGWFQAPLVWARGEIIEYLGNMENTAGQNMNACDCPDAPIDICDLRTDLKARCLSTNSLYDSYGECAAKCLGAATYSPEKGLCVLKDAFLAYEGGTLGMEYHLRLQPQQEKIFGEVLISSNLQSLISKSQDYYKCEDRSGVCTSQEVQGTTKIINEQGQCASQSISAQNSGELSDGLSAPSLSFTIPSNIANIIGYNYFAFGPRKYASSTYQLALCQSSASFNKCINDLLYAP